MTHENDCVTILRCSNNIGPNLRNVVTNSVENKNNSNNELIVLYFMMDNQKTTRNQSTIVVSTCVCISGGNDYDKQAPC